MGGLSIPILSTAWQRKSLVKTCFRLADTACSPQSMLLQNMGYLELRARPREALHCTGLSTSVSRVFETHAPYKASVKRVLLGIYRSRFSCLRFIRAYVRRVTINVNYRANIPLKRSVSNRPYFVGTAFEAIQHGQIRSIKNTYSTLHVDGWQAKPTKNINQTAKSRKVPKS